VEYRSYPILYVDDDPLNLRSFEALFGDTFQIVTAPSGEAALELLGRSSVAVLLSDQRLGPGMAGTDLCALVRERYPEIVRMIVTAYGDLATTIAGINAGQISRYISKPWKKDEMAAALRLGIDEYYLRAFAREIQALMLGRQQQSASDVVVARVLHEICNPTTAVHINLMCAESALRSLDPLMGVVPAPFAATFRELRETIRDARAASADVLGQVDRLREGETLPASGPGQADVDRILRAAIAPLRGELARRASLVLELGAEPRVAVAPSYLAQIVLNLLPMVVAACDPARAAANRVVIGSFAGEAAGGFTIRFPADDAASARDAAEERDPEARDDPRVLALLIVRQLIAGAGGRFDMVDQPDDMRELRVELPLAARPAAA